MLEESPSDLQSDLRSDPRPDPGFDPLSDPLRPPPPMTWRDRFDELISRAREVVDSPARLAATVLLVAGVGLAGYVILRPPVTRPPVEATLPLAAPLDAAAAPTSSTTAAQVVVHAAGAVTHPGLYRLAAGSRVDDLVLAAGGLTVEADIDRLNLAAPLADGQRIYIPRVGESAPPMPVGGDAGGSGTSSSSGGDAGPVNLNTATVEQLDALPGIGPATAQAIVSHRDTRGPFKAVDDLLDVRGIGPAKLEQLRPLVTV